MQSQLSGSGTLLGFIEGGKNRVFEKESGKRLQIRASPLTSTPLQRIHFKDNA